MANPCGVPARSYFDPRNVAATRKTMMPLLVVILCALSFAEATVIFPARLCDFRAFYCAGRAVLAGADPYREHPLSECEHALPGPLVSDLPADITIPAPYPSFVLCAFALLARLPFNLAVALWTLASTAALIAAIAIVARLSAVPVAAAAIVLGLPAVVIPLPLGQPTLFVLLAVVGTAVLLEQHRPRRAALAALVTLVDPHAGIALCAAVFIGVPRTRLTLLAGASALAACGAVAFGVGREIEYVRDVLPLHALVNVPEFSQLSTANLAYSAGLSAPLALAIGNGWYGVAVLVGIVAGLRLRRTFGVAALALVPIAFAVFGGSHTHLQQIALALPALLMVTAACTNRFRPALVGLTFVAAVPWLISGASPPQFLAIPVLGFVFARLMKTAAAGPWLAAGSFALLAGLCAAIVHAHGSALPRIAPTSGNPLAEIAWGRFVEASSVPVQAWYTLGKLPTLAAVGAMLAIVLAAARRPLREAEPVRTQAALRAGRSPA